MDLSKKEQKLLRALQNDKAPRMLGAIGGIVFLLLAIPFAVVAVRGLDFSNLVLRHAFTPLSLLWLDSILLFAGLYLVAVALRKDHVQDLVIRMWERVVELEAHVDGKPPAESDSAASE